MTVHWHVSVDKMCKMVLLKWSTNRLIVILFWIRSEHDQLLDAVSEKGKCIQHIVRGHCQINLNTIFPQMNAPPRINAPLE